MERPFFPCRKKTNLGGGGGGGGGGESKKLLSSSSSFFFFFASALPSTLSPFLSHRINGLAPSAEDFLPRSPSPTHLERKGPRIGPKRGASLTCKRKGGERVAHQNSKGKNKRDGINYTCAYHLPYTKYTRKTQHRLYCCPH